MSDSRRRYIRLPWRRRDRIVRDVDDELAFHLDMRTAELEQEGLSAIDARREARLAFGDLEFTRRYLFGEDQAGSRRARRGAIMSELVQDVRFAGRQMRRSPVFTAVALATLALGIGGTAALYGVVDATLIRPLPFVAADRLVRLWGVNRTSANTHAFFSYPNFVDLTAQARA
jgi:putative ABC transport system permease protein